MTFEFMIENSYYKEGCKETREMAGVFSSKHKSHTDDICFKTLSFSAASKLSLCPGNNTKNNKGHKGEPEGSPVAKRLFLLLVCAVWPFHLKSKRANNVFVVSNLHHFKVRTDPRFDVLLNHKLLYHS